jgi:hypothetical protein
MKACAATQLQSFPPVEEARDDLQDDDLYEDDRDDVAADALFPVVNVNEQPPGRHCQHYRLNAKHIETLKFLGPMCGGLPVGDEKLKAMLKYAKSLESERGRFLPKTPATAWRRLAKVRTYAYCCVACFRHSGIELNVFMKKQFMYNTCNLRCFFNVHVTQIVMSMYCM